MAHHDPLVSIVIVNYNGMHFLDDCLASIAARVSMPHEVIVVDNASTDQSVPHLRRNHPGVVLIASDTNRGFSAGNNLGVGQAHGEYVLLLNNDTALCTDIAPAVELLAANPAIGIVGAMMLDAEGHYRPSARHFPIPRRLFRLASRMVRTGPFESGDFADDASAHYAVDCIEGSFFLTRKSLFTDLGGFDEHLFMYGEDTEFCYRAARSGLRTVYCAAVKYIHLGGFTPDREYLVVAGIKHFHRKWSSPPRYALVCAILYARLLLRLLVYRAWHLCTGDPTSKGKIESSAFALKQFFTY